MLSRHENFLAVTGLKENIFFFKIAAFWYSERADGCTPYKGGRFTIPGKLKSGSRFSKKEQLPVLKNKNKYGGNHFFKHAMHKKVT